MAVGDGSGVDSGLVAGVNLYTTAEGEAGRKVAHADSVSRWQVPPPSRVQLAYMQLTPLSGGDTHPNASCISAASAWLVPSNSAQRARHSALLVLVKPDAQERCVGSAPLEWQAIAVPIFVKSEEISPATTSGSASKSEKSEKSIMIVDVGDGRRVGDVATIIDYLPLRNRLLPAARKKRTKSARARVLCMLIEVLHCYIATSILALSCVPSA